MRCYVRNFVRWLIVAFFIVCYTLLIILWQVDVPRNQVSQWSETQDGGAGGAVQKTREYFQERAPRSIEDRSIEDQNIPRKINFFVVKDALSHSTTLNDLFLSVKTTKVFHQSRLNIILRTWFVLARDQ
ncbi:Fringe glycosyltransferase, partial [Stegodyphus mimosarum]